MNKYHVAFLATIPIQAIIYATIWKYYQYVEYAMIILSWLAFACVFGLVGYMACMGYWRIQDRKTGVDLKRAKVALRMAKAKRLDQIVTVIKPGHHIAITHTNPIKSITYAAPPLPLADKVSTINQIAAPTSDANIMDGVRMGEGWIKEVLFNDDGGLKVHHVSVNGPTGAGKTWFMLYMMWLLQQPHPSAEYWLLDPSFDDLYNEINSGCIRLSGVKLLCQSLIMPVFLPADSVLKWYCFGLYNKNIVYFSLDPYFTTNFAVRKDNPCLIFTK